LSITDLSRTLFPRIEFEQAVQAHQAERHMRGFPCWGQFVAMLFCQLGQARSLREICGGLAATEGRLEHLGLDGAPKRSTLAYANQHRPWQLYQSVFERLLGRCQSRVAAQGGGKRFRFRNRLLSLDASVIDLSLSLYDWPRFRRAKGAVKLHLLLDHDGYLPQFAVLTDGKTHELTVARKLSFEPGAVVVFDRAYIDYQWFAELGRRGVYFVTRLKRNADYAVLESRATPARGGILADEVICFPGRAAESPEYVFRRIVKQQPGDDEPLVFLTNHLGFDPTTVAAIYKDRWQVELFFKALKQNLRVKTFVGVSANAVRTQLFTALIAILVLRYLQLRARFGWSLSNLAALLRQQLFVYRDLWAWLDEPFEPPPQAVAASAQLALPLAGR